MDTNKERDTFRTLSVMGDALQDALGVSGSMRVKQVMFDDRKGEGSVWIAIGDNDHGGRGDLGAFLQRERRGRFCESVMAGQEAAFGLTGHDRAMLIREELEKGNYWEGAKIAANSIEGCVPECRAAMKTILQRKRPRACLSLRFREGRARLNLAFRGHYDPAGWSGDGETWIRFGDSPWLEMDAIETGFTAYIDGKFPRFAGAGVPGQKASQ